MLALRSGIAELGGGKFSCGLLVRMVTMGSGPCLPRFAELPKLPSVFLLFVYCHAGGLIEFVGAAIGDDFFS